MKLLKLIAVLLDYPQDELWAHGEELRQAVDDPALSPARRAARRKRFCSGCGTATRPSEAGR